MAISYCCMEITDDCICCDACIDECPNEAILENSGSEDIYYIVDFLCDCCEGETEKACVAVCPVDAIVKGDCGST